MRTLSGIVSDVEYFDTSRNGNSRYTASIGGVRCFTGLDSSLGSAIKNYEGKRVKVDARLIRGKLTISGGPEVLPDDPYMVRQLDALNVATGFVRGDVTMQLRAPGGHTNWLTITPAQFEAIADILKGSN